MSSPPRPLPTPRLALAQLPLFADIAERTLQRLTASARIIDLPGHRTLYQRGEDIRDAFVLIEGALKRTAGIGIDGQLLELVAPGQFCGLAEFVAGSRYASSAETLQASLLLALDVQELRRTSAQDATLCSVLLAALARSHQASETDTVRQRALPVPQRVLDYLLELSSTEGSSVHLGASKRVIAAHLDMAPETLSRTLRQLAEDGLIAVENRTVHLLPAALRPAAASRSS